MMITRNKTATRFLLILVVLGGCMNMPTPPAQITGSYTSKLQYVKFTCSQLGAEANSLARRENQLIVAQKSRMKTSEMQAFWYGYGQGDGIEASELANVRGEKEAVRSAMETKGCEIPTTLVKPAPMPTSGIQIEKKPRCNSPNCR